MFADLGAAERFNRSAAFPFGPPGQILKSSFHIFRKSIIGHYATTLPG